MIDKKIIDIANSLQLVMNQHLEAARKAMLDVPEGETRLKLEELLKSASTGKLKPEDAQKELEKIIKNAR